ncbi:polysaccharide biosynthesis tyrosine autokinase [Isoptericola aurantiacus]|uniref:polysaccharide biosynthesis tyrosine autokinase n=1 Tax=Isoptericola aurantiacus TaxID=3377839 RepID=UPI003839EEBE
MTVRDFLQVVWAGKYYVLVAVLLVVAGAWLYLDRLQTVYESSAVVQINSADSITGDTAVAALGSIDPLVVTSDPVARAAADELGYPGSPDDLTNAVNAEYDANAQTVTIIADAASPGGAEEIADAFASAYVGYLPTVRDDQIAALDERRDALRSQLEEVQGQLRVNKNDPLANAEQESIVAQYQAVSAQRSTLQSIVEPGSVLTTATPAVALGLSPASVLALAAILGLVAGVGLAFARRGLDFHVRSADEAAAVSEVNVLAELYGVREAAKQAGGTSQLPITSRAASPFTESIRELRTAVRVSLGGREHSVIMVTAADPAAPRAFIVANLAASWALSGQRTIVFSADLRRPQLDEWLPAPEGWSGDATALRPTTVPNLELQPVPDVHMDPADFLATAEVRGLVDGLRERAEVIVIDAPPVLAAADATILGGYADGAVVLASAGRTDRVVLAEAVQRLRINDVAISGLALSGVKGDRRTQYASVYGDGESRPAAGPDVAPASAASAPSAASAGSASSAAVAPHLSASSGSSSSPEAAESADSTTSAASASVSSAAVPEPRADGTKGPGSAPDSSASDASTADASTADAAAGRAAVSVPVALRSPASASSAPAPAVIPPTGEVTPDPRDRSRRPAENRHAARRPSPVWQPVRRSRDAED